jgi:hypothetical protein
MELTGTAFLCLQMTRDEICANWISSRPGEVGEDREGGFPDLVK